MVIDFKEFKFLRVDPDLPLNISRLDLIQIVNSPGLVPK